MRLDDAQARAQTAAAAAAVAAAEDRARQSQATLAVLASQIHETALGGEQATADSSGRVAQARADVAAAQAQAAQAAAVIGQAQANLALASADRARYDALSRTGDVSVQRAQEADASYRSTAAALKQQRAALAAVQQNGIAAAAALDLARSTSYNAPIHAAQVVTLERQQHQAQAQIAAANADARQARAAQRQAEAALSDLIVRAASDGTVTARAVEPGMVVAAGRTLKQDRVQQVFGVKLDLRAPRGDAKPGMPADAQIDIAPS